MRSIVYGADTAVNLSTSDRFYRSIRVRAASNTAQIEFVSLQAKRQFVEFLWIVSLFRTISAGLRWEGGDLGPKVKQLSRFSLE